MKAEQYLQLFKGDQICTVNGNKVWDYKETDNFKEIRLISEQVEESESFDYVTAAELSEFIGLFASSAELIDETTGELVKSI